MGLCVDIEFYCTNNFLNNTIATKKYKGFEDRGTFPFLQTG